MNTVKDIASDIRHMVDVIRTTNAKLYQTLPDDTDDLCHMIMDLGNDADDMEKELQYLLDKEKCLNLQHIIKTHLEYIRYTILRHDEIEMYSNDEAVVNQVMDKVTKEIMGLWEPIKE